MDNDGLFRDRGAYCLSCQAGLAQVGARRVCESCGAALVTAAELAEMLRAIDAADARPLDARLTPATAPPRRCPACDATMTMHLLEDIVVDRCAAHGVWFDGGELERVLTHVADGATRRRMAGKAGFALGVLATYAAVETAVFSAVVAAPLAAVAVGAFAVGGVRRWRVRRRFARSQREA